jgi:hypothetical protein
VRPDDTLDVVPSDADDNRVIECALTSRSDTIVTGDTDLLVLGSFLGIRIVNPSDFLLEGQVSWSVGSSIPTSGNDAPHVAIGRDVLQKAAER